MTAVIIIRYLSTLLLFIGPQAASEPADETRIVEARAAFTACKAESANTNPLLARVAYSQETHSLCITGDIDGSLASAVRKKLDELANAGDAQVSHVVLSSDGGQLRPAIDIASEIEKLNASVVVGERCASSCAQFLFLAGKDKILLKGGLLLFHGGPVPDDTIAAMSIPDAAKQHLRSEQEAFRAFYHSHGIDMAMLTNPPADVQRELDAGMLALWSWPTDKLKAFGIDGVFQE